MKNCLTLSPVTKPWPSRAIDLKGSPVGFFCVTLPAGSVADQRRSHRSKVLSAFTRIRNVRPTMIANGIATIFLTGLIFLQSATNRSSQARGRVAWTAADTDSARRTEMVRRSVVLCAVRRISSGCGYMRDQNRFPEGWRQRAPVDWQESGARPESAQS